MNDVILVGIYYITATRGLTQGDPLSPTLFNIVVDAIIRAWLASQQNGDDDAIEGGDKKFMEHQP
jgi:hypothetical protein